VVIDVLMPACGRNLCRTGYTKGEGGPFQSLKADAMKIPEEIKIPVLVFTLEAIMVAGFLLIFLVLVPQ
jgi:hypothetical protein